MNLLFNLVFLEVSMSEAYQFFCPPQANWNLRANNVCTDPKNYNCLYNVTLQVNVYGERCSKPRILGPGSKYVFQPNLNRAACRNTRYQPFIFDTIGYSDCTFRKSLCNSEGQMTYKNGNTTSDRTCFCNTAKGFNFNNNPQNSCYCNPSTEDCSCYIGIDTNNNTESVKDFRCSSDGEITADSIETSQAMQINEFDNYKYNKAYPTSGNRTIAAVFVLILVVLYPPVAVGICFLRKVSRRMNKKHAPDNFEIVDCTDNSMTIEWDITDSENYLEYKIVDPIKGSADWEQKLLSAKDVVVKENERCVYILYLLSPDTSYELKMCYIDKNQVKSKYTESQTHRTLKAGPKNFDIIDSTESSITIKWKNDDSDNRQGYILDHRNKISEKWIDKELSSENIKTNEDGCNVYTLQELLPETLYELRLCSVDYQQISSQYTESKLRHTLQIAIPKAFNQLQEEDKIRYINIMQRSATEKRYFVRIMIVGKDGVGKSCLMRRLLNESIAGVTSTDGVDIVVRRCKINIRDGKWTVDKFIPDDTADRIKMAIMKDQNKMENGVYEEDVSAVSETYHQQINPYKAKSTIDQSIIDVSLGNHNMQNVTYNSSMTRPSDGERITLNVDKMDASSTNLNENDNEDNDSEYNVNGDETVSNTSTKCILTENEDSNTSKHLVMPSDLMSEVFTMKSTSDSPSIHYALCGLWDFAGQREFYGTHQAFLTNSAIYLVVADMDTAICKQMTELDGTENKADHKQESMDSFKDLQAGEYMDFWFDSIHCYRSANLAVDNSPIDPPVIVVFTGKDKCKKTNLIDMKERQLDDELTRLVAKDEKYRHYRHKFCVSNTEDENEVFQKIQDKISEIARKMSNWGEPVPLKWILLETLIDINRNSGKSFITLDEMIKIAKHPQIEIHDFQEVLLFLRFQHEVGKVIFFDDISNLIILDPQWLANAFRCLVSDRINIIDDVEDKDKIQIASDMIDLKNKGKISDLLIKTLFRLKGGIQFLNQMEDLLRVMEKFDILVKFGYKHSYIMPSMMPSTSFSDVCQNIGIFQDHCYRSTWFCLKFDFLPPTFFSHVSVWLMKKYEPCKFKVDKKSSALVNALFRGFCVFDLDEGACDKLLMTMSTDTIALQIASFQPSKELEEFCASIRKELIEKVKDIQKGYKLEVSYDEMFKCSDHSDATSFDLLKTKEEFYCRSCKTLHISKTIYLPWIPECSEIETTPDGDTKVSKPVGTSRNVRREQDGFGFGVDTRTNRTSTRPTADITPTTTSRTRYQPGSTQPRTTALDSSGNSRRNRAAVFDNGINRKNKPPSRRHQDQL